MSDLHILSVAEILAADDLKEEVVACPEWGGAVKIKGLTKDQITKMTREATVTGRVVDPRTGQRPSEVNAEALNELIFAEGVVEPKFGPADIYSLRGKSAAPFLRITKAIMRLAGLGEDSAARAEAEFPDGPGSEVPIPTSA